MACQQIWPFNFYPGSIGSSLALPMRISLAPQPPSAGSIGRHPSRVAAPAVAGSVVRWASHRSVASPACHRRLLTVAREVTSDPASRTPRDKANQSLRSLDQESSSRADRGLFREPKDQHRVSTAMRAKWVMQRAARNDGNTTADAVDHHRCHAHFPHSTDKVTGIAVHKIAPSGAKIPSKPPTPEEVACFSGSQHTSQSDDVSHQNRKL